jgi:SAM-dependent methyltransferase
MPAKNYSALADIYPHMMRSIDYKKWAKYIYQISKEVKKKNISVLELASGSGNIAVNLHKKFRSFTSTDLSISMLRNNSEYNIPKVCCDMTKLPFKSQFDFIFCTFDSINYLTTKDKYLSLFGNINNCLTNTGVFTFDASLENNSLKYQRYLNRKGKVNGITYQQRSFYNRQNRFHYNQFEIILANGKKVEEIHKQKIFRFQDYFDFITNSNLYVHKCYRTFTHENADNDSERVQFILKKKTNVKS